ncbi:MAG: diguanylate cyclase domain-containing protein, partial [Acidimicrobiales bacterium]
MSMHLAAGDRRSRWPLSARSARTFLLAGLIVAALMVVAGEPVRGWLLVALVVAAAGAGVVAVRRNPARDNPAWLLLFGAVLQVPAYALWYPARLEWDLELGNPGITDVLFLAGYVCLVAAMAQVVRSRSGSERHIHLLDTLIISVGLGVLVWVVFISPYLHDEGLSWPARLVAVSYPLVDLLLFAAVARLLVQAGITTGGDRLLALWVANQLAADLTYSVTSLQGTFAVQDPSVALYASSFVVLGAVLLHPTALARKEVAAPEQPASGARRIAVVGAATLIAPTVLVVLGLQGNSRDVPTVALLAAVIFGLVLLRIWLLMVDVREHHRIQQRLTESVELERRRAEENHELLASLSERQMLSDRLFRIQRKISTRAPLHEVLDSVVHGAAELLRDDVVGLRLLDEDDPSTMVMVASVGVPEHLAVELNRLPVGVGVGGRALVENRVCIEESYLDWDNAIEGFKESGLTSAMATPVHLAGKPIGSLVVASTRPVRRYSAAEQDALSAFAEHVSLALNDARTVQAMHRALDQALHQAMHDDLTGLPNRACFYDRTAEALIVARAEGAKTAVLLFDLDRFKEINDTLGHRYGDRVLRAIGPRIADLLGPEEVLARLGGDEFCVLMPRVTGEEEALELA